jgi:hypothetical protein
LHGRGTEYLLTKMFIYVIKRRASALRFFMD